MKKRTAEARVQPTGAVIYLRVSTDDQATNIQNLPNRDKICREGWKSRGEILCQFVDAGESARAALSAISAQSLGVRYTNPRLAADNTDTSCC